MKGLPASVLWGSWIAALPMILWSRGLSPNLMLPLHISTGILTGGFLIYVSRLSETRREALWAGGFMGSISTLISQIILHLPTSKASLAVAFTAYGPLGARMYALDALTRWWPFVLTVIMTILYLLETEIIYRLYGRFIKQTPQKKRLPNEKNAPHKQ